MASYTLDPLIGKIISILENEASSLRGVREELEEMKLELMSMRSFLKDADKNIALTSAEETWVEQVRNIVYEIEDIIHEFMYRMNRDQSGGRFTRILHQTTHFPKNLWARHQMASKLKKINKMVKAIPERSQRYGTDHLERKTSPSNTKWVRRSESSLLTEDDKLVGIESVKNELLGRLTDGQPQRTVISVLGMGGSGKTTLVASTYKSQIVKQHFNCYAWITVSQTYVIEDLLRVMIKEFYKEGKEEIPTDLGTMSKRDLAEMLKSYLQLKRYFVVLDDVWTTKLWSEINVALPDGMHGSRVMVTTRIEDVARYKYGVGGHVQPLEPLGMDEAWELFCMNAFQSKYCPEELLVHAKNLVEKCAGLPLAIVALGGLMSSKESEYEWGKVYDSLNWELSNNPGLEGVKNVLLLSINELPYQLKYCFLYCCIFPEDYEIRRKRLIRLWMAEGFVQEDRGSSPEEVAESYLTELIRRSMLQVAKRNPSGRPKRCKMHDLLRELALSISEKQMFCDLYNRKNSTEERGARRLSYEARDKEIESGKGFSKLRSFFLFADDNISNSSLNKLSLGFKLLWVLDLEDAPIGKLPDELVKLFNLKYLNLTSTKVDELPKSIGKLSNLQTLDMKSTKIKELPAGIVKLQNLRHLITFRGNPGHGTDFDFSLATQAPSDICKLKNLQVLSAVEVQGDLIRQLKNMTQLRRLGLTKVREGDEKDLCIALENMKLLHFLWVHATNEEETLRMDALSSAPRLRRLFLVGKLVKVPHWFNSLQSLTQLHLHWSRLREDILPHIQALPNLARLTLVNAYVGKRLCFLRGFQKLKNLDIINCPQLNEIVIGEGVMPGLVELWLWKCMELKAVPHGIEYLTCLRLLALDEVSDELIGGIRGDGSVDRPRVQHIPLIRYVYQTGSGWVYDNLA